MKELSLNILDIAGNSVKAEATLIRIELTETDKTLLISISDDGYGMTAEKVAKVTDPFFTSRTTRKVGLGIPFFKLAAEQTGGEFLIVSRSRDEYPDSHGTTTSALFYKDSIDFTPLGDVISTVCTLIQGNDDIEFLYTHDIKTESREAYVKLDTTELKAVLGGIPLSEPEILSWIKDYLTEQYNTD